MQKIHKLKAAAAVALTLAIFLTFPLVCAFASAKPRTYKVGANEMFGINKTDAGYAGIACDYLNAIAKYTGDKYTYVYGSEEELFRKLKDGEIDLIPCVTDHDRTYYEALFGGEEGELFQKTNNALISRFSAVYVYDKGSFKDTVLN